MSNVLKKGRSDVIESILIDHVLQWKGRDVNVVITDNGSVGKRLPTFIVLSQYVVDQGLYLVCLIIFLEKNYEKLLCDMLIGQFQTR